MDVMTPDDWIPSWRLDPLNYDLTKLLRDKDFEEAAKRIDPFKEASEWNPLKPELASIMDDDTARKVQMFRQVVIKDRFLV